MFNSTKHEKSAPVDTLQCRIFESGHFTKLPSENQGRKSTMLVNCTRKISNVLFADNVLFILKLAGGKTLKVPRNNNKGSDVSTKSRKKGAFSERLSATKKNEEYQGKKRENGAILIRGRRAIFAHFLLGLLSLRKQPTASNQEQGRRDVIIITKAIDGSQISNSVGCIFPLISCFVTPWPFDGPWNGVVSPRQQNGGR